jgi:hypothetical protein
MLACWLLLLDTSLRIAEVISSAIAQLPTHPHSQSTYLKIK